MKKWYEIGLIIFSFIIYGQGILFSFTNWDDTQYILNNEWIRNFDSNLFRKAFSEAHFGHYHPLTWISLAFDYKLFGLKAWGFHLHNILLHIFNVLLVFTLTKKIISSNQLSFFVALAFSLHPFVNESVMWITERKNLLFVFFYLLCLWFYIRSIEKDSLVWLLISFIVFIFSALSKATAITLPVVLVGLLYLYNKLTWKNIIYLIPFALFTLFAIYMANKAQAPFLKNNESLDVYTSFMFSSWAFGLYIFKAILPTSMSAFHPIFLDSIEPYYILGFLLFIIFIFFIIRAIKQKNRILVFALCFFMVNIVIYLKIFNAFASSYFMAERYTYLSYWGLYIAIFSIIKPYLKHKIANIVIFVWFIFLSFQSFVYGKTWQNSLRLWENVIHHYPKSHIALLNYGNALRESGYYDKALEAYHKIDTTSSLYAKMLENRAYVYYKQNNYQAALNDYQALLLIDSTRYDIKTYIVNILLENNKLELAKQTAMDILRTFPQQSEVWNSLGNYYYQKKQVDSALWAYTHAISIKPKGMYYYNRANVYSQNNQLLLAIADYNKAIELDSMQADYYLNRAITYFKLKNHLEALHNFNKAILLKPTQKDYYLNRATLYVSQNMYRMALADINMALELDPNDATILVRRSYLYYQLNEKESACNDAQRVVALGYSQYIEWQKKVCQ
ncbi:MAG: tetratricopeptide repeat protein [Bacteroidales bacterium]|nr:tetratricopeptide repeat protein [Bacteroidales bacterium]